LSWLKTLSWQDPILAMSTRDATVTPQYSRYL
jgi:hypothetical protein